MYKISNKYSNYVYVYYTCTCTCSLFYAYLESFCKKDRPFAKSLHPHNLITINSVSQVCITYIKKQIVSYILGDLWILTGE